MYIRFILGEDEESSVYSHKNYLYDLIAGVPEDNLYQESDFVPPDELFCEQDAIDQFKSPGGIQKWLNEFDDRSNDTCYDTCYDGEKNTLYNPAFVPFLLNLCKTLVLWSAVNAKMFKADVNANSSANVESYFKDVKMSLKDEIPCRADEFISAHIDMINGMVIDASQYYVDFVDAAGGLAQFRETNLNEFKIDLNETPILDEFAENFTTNEENSDDAKNSKKSDSNQLQHSENNAENAENSALNEDNFTGDETNSKLGDLESSSRSSSARSRSGLRSVSRSRSSSRSQSQNGCDEHSPSTSAPNSKKDIGKKNSLSLHLNEKDKWSKNKRGKGKFFQPMPFLKLMTSEKKTPKIGFLRNASLSTVTHTINGKKIKLKNTCGIDSLLQVILNL